MGHTISLEIYHVYYWLHTLYLLLASLKLTSLNKDDTIIVIQLVKMYDFTQCS